MCAGGWTSFCRLPPNRQPQCRARMAPGQMVTSLCLHHRVWAHHLVLSRNQASQHFARRTTA